MSFQSQQKSVVEIGRGVTVIFVDHERLGQCTQVQQTMSVQIRARPSRDLQRKNRAPSTAFEGSHTR